MNTELPAAIEAAAAHPKNLGEMNDADAVGTVGSADCGDLLRMWIKFKEEDGRRVIDKASFQTFGCQTAIAVASVATEIIRGRTAEEALALSGEELSAPLGPLPPMKIHCAQLVEGALRSALTSPASTPGDTMNSPAPDTHRPVATQTLMDSLLAGAMREKPIRIKLKPGNTEAQKD